MKLRLMLARSAEVQAGMLYMLGTGWTEIGPAPSPFAIAGIIEVPWGRPPGVAPGRSFNLPIAINIVPLQLRAGRHYVVKAFIDGELADEVGFSVRQQPGVGQQPPR